MPNKTTFHSNKLQQALTEWSRLLGAANLTQRPEGKAELDAAARATFATSQTVQAILRPADTAEVCACLKVANNCSVNVHPVSSGKNWGYGSRVPASDAVLLDLSRLSTIIDYNEALGYVTIGAGLTFAQLTHFLAERDSDLLVQAPGSSKNASIIANAIERGFGQGQQADRVNSICAMQLVLGNGEIVRTGAMGRGRHVHKRGVGPSLDGVFSQSRFGIVTELTLWLERRPAAWRHFSIKLPKDSLLAPLITVLQALRREGLLDTQVSLFNNLRMLSLENQFPFEEFDPAVGMTVLETRLLSHSHGITDWYVEAGIAGADATIVDRKCELIRSRIAGLGRLEFGELCGTSVFYSNKSETSVKSAFWRCRESNGNVCRALDDDPAKYGCGIYQLSAVCEFDGAEVREACDIINRVFQEHAFEAAISVQAMDSRLIYIIVTLSFALTDPSESARAKQCRTAVQDELRSHNFYPYRSGLQSFGEFSKDTPISMEILQQLREIFDPNDVISPGRYDGASG